MSVTIRNRTPGPDPIARAHQRASIARAVGYTSVVAIVLGGLTWLLFASASFAVTDIQVSGASENVNTQLRLAVEDVLGKKTLGFLRPARNMLLLNEEGVAQLLRTTFKNIEGVHVAKNYPHTLTVAARERVPMGTWCFQSECQYFDVSGARWGSAVPSKGPLLLYVQDERPADSWDDRIFASLITVVGALPDMGLRPIMVTLPNTAPGDLWIRVSTGYDVILDALGDIGDQLDTLAVLIADRAIDSTWKPQYIDARTPGRVYYK